MAGGPPFNKKETEIGKLSCESKQAGMISSLEVSPSYINRSTASSPMMMSPSSAPTSNSLQEQHPMISRCSPQSISLEANPSYSLAGTDVLNRGEKRSITSPAPFSYRPGALTRTSDGSFTAEPSQAKPPYLMPTSNPNPNSNPALKPSHYPSPSLNSVPSLLNVDDKYASSPLHHMLPRNERQLHDRFSFDPDHQGGLTHSDDHLFGGFRNLLSSHVSSPLFSESLQPGWSPMITDFPFPYCMGTHKETAALMSPASEITGAFDLQDADMSLFSSSIAARRWSLYDESSASRRGLLDTISESPPTTAASAMEFSGTQNQAPEPRIGDQEDFRAAHDQSLAPPSPSLEDEQFVEKNTASVSHSGAAGGESEGIKRASPATDISSSSGSELQDEEDSIIARPAGAQAMSGKHEEGDAADSGKPEADVDNKPSKKPRKKGQRRVREPRVALVTKSEVEQLEDGYRWRKYGQKAVKNSPHPRSYYRCTNSKCYVKKRVERCNEDPSLVVTTYEGQHTHHSPAVLRGTHDHMLADSLISGSLGPLNYNSNAPFLHWQSSLMPPNILSSHTPSHFPTSSNFRASLNQLFRPLHATPPTSLLTKPLSFPSTPLALSPSLDHSRSLPRNFAMHPPQLQGALPSMLPMPHLAVQTSTAAHDQLPLSSPIHQLANPPQTSHRQGLAHASPTLLSSRIDKGLLDDMLSHASPRKQSPSAPP